MMRFTCAGSVGSANWRAERLRFNFRVGAGAAVPRRHLATGVLDRPRADRHDERRCCSAPGRNSAGSSSPCSGWSQRMSASNPATRPVAQLTIGR